jgi:hypothetical protein
MPITTTRREFVEKLYGASYIKEQADLPFPVRTDTRPFTFDFENAGPRAARASA